jgi:hypothetical protein
VKLSLVDSQLASIQLSASDLEVARQNGLSLSNSYRSRHGVPPQKINATLNDQAQQHALSMAAAQRQFFLKDNIGQNLNMLCVYQQITNVQGAIRSKSEISKCLHNNFIAFNFQLDIVSGSVKTWYSQIKKYNYNNPKFSSSTSGFTQLVWKSSTEIGIGVGMSYLTRNGHNFMCK